MEAAGFRDALDEFKKKKTAIIGISRDKPATQKKWAENRALAFPLLSDPDAAVHKKYGAWGEKSMYGKKVEGVIRTTVVVGANGAVEKIYRNVKPIGHAAAVLGGL